MCSCTVIGLQIRYFKASMRATVVIPCYKPNEHFDKVLDDLNAQTSQEFEVVLVDDGNEPPLQDRVDRRLSRPFRIIRFDTNRGIVAGLNAAVASATTPYVVRMDADDRMPAYRIERQLAWMDRHPDVDVAGGAMLTFGQKVRLWAHPSEVPAAAGGLLWGPTLNHPTVIAKTAVLQATPYPADSPLGEDYALWLRLVEQGRRLGNMDEVMVYYRLEGQNTSQTGQDSRGERYFSLFERAVTSLLPLANRATVMQGVRAGAHHVLAGVALPSSLDKPGNQMVQAHGRVLLEALAEVEAPWARRAEQSVQQRLRRQERTLPWHKAKELIDPWLIGFSHMARVRASGF